MAAGRTLESRASRSTAAKVPAAPVDEHPSLRKNAEMAEATTSDDWADRHRAQAAGFDVIGTHYDEVFPHKEGQVRIVEQLLERLPASARVLDLGCGTGVPTARQLVDGGCEVPASTSHR